MTSRWTKKRSATAKRTVVSRAAGNQGAAEEQRRVNRRQLPTFTVLGFVSSVLAAIIVGGFAFYSTTKQVDAENNRDATSTLQTRAANAISTAEQLFQAAGPNPPAGSPGVLSLNRQVIQQYDVLLMSSSNSTIEHAILAVYHDAVEVGLDAGNIHALGDEHHTSTECDIVLGRNQSQLAPTQGEFSWPWPGLVTSP
jgi:hypothetical protein